MNIIGMRQEKRAKEIMQIRASIKKAKKPLDRKKIVLATMSALNLSKRTASEYVEVALFELGIEI